jgi:hypothetical protein
MTSWQQPVTADRMQSKRDMFLWCVDRTANSCRQNFRVRSHFSHWRIWDFAGGIVTSLKAKQPQNLIRIPAGWKEAPRQVLWTTQSPIRWMSGTFPPTVNSQVVKLYNSHPSISGVNNEWRYTSTIPYASCCAQGRPNRCYRSIENRRWIKFLVISVLCVLMARMSTLQHCREFLWLPRWALQRYWLLRREVPSILWNPKFHYR